MLGRPRIARSSVALALACAALPVSLQWPDVLPGVAFTVLGGCAIWASAQLPHRGWGAALFTLVGGATLSNVWHIRVPEEDNLAGIAVPLLILLGWAGFLLGRALRIARQPR